MIVNAFFTEAPFMYFDELIISVEWTLVKISFNEYLLPLISFNCRCKMN